MVKRPRIDPQSVVKILWEFGWLNIKSMECWVKVIFQANISTLKLDIRQHITHIF